MAGKTRGCEIARKYAELIKSLLKVSVDNNREMGVVFCLEDSDVKVGATSIGSEMNVVIPTCPPGKESVMRLHTHVDLDFFSTADFISFAATDDEASCIAYLSEDGEPYVKCIHKPDNAEEWLDKVSDLTTIEDEAARAYYDYTQALQQVVNVIEEEGELSNRAAIVKELRKRKDNFASKLETLRKKAIELEPDACVIKL